MSKNLVYKMDKDLVYRRIKEDEGGKKEEITYCNISSDLKTSLSDILDADHGLLQMLRPVLTDREFSSLQSLKDYDRIDKLMEHVNQLPQHKFFEALRETGQMHVVNFINKNGKSHQAVNETCWPLTEEQRETIKSNLFVLADLLDVDSLLPVLLSANCITRRHHENILAKGTTFDRCCCLLEILLKRSQADYNGVVRALVEIDQSNLAYILSEGGKVVAARTVLANPLSEDEAVVMFKQWWTEASPDERQRLNDQLGPDIKVVEMQKSTSIAVYFLCKTYPAFQHLATMLKSVLGAILSDLLNDRYDRHVEITELGFYESSYNSCLHFFCKSMGYYDKFSVCDPHNETDVIRRKKCSARINDLLLELLEIVLVKGVVLFYKHLVKLSTDAESISIAAVLMVCQHWLLVLENRPFNKEKIKRTLADVCRPLRRRIDSRCINRLLVTQKDGSKSPVRGVATLGKQLFVVSDESSTVCVFDLTPPFTEPQSIELEGILKDPSDIATCEITKRIYIADWGNGCVWYIDCSSSSSSRSVSRFIECEGYWPWSLSTSVHRKQLLVTDNSKSLYVYDVDGKLIQRVELSTTEFDDPRVTWNNVQHAVQATAGDSYFVCRLGVYKQLQNTTHAEVVQYSSTGERLRCYYTGPRGNGSHQLNDPVYMSLLDDGRFFLVDREARRIVLLNTELKLERVLITKQQLNVDSDDESSRPVGLCYSSQTGQLCVVMNNSRVDVYKIC